MASSSLITAGLRSRTARAIRPAFNARASLPKIVVCTSLALDDPAELGILAHSAGTSWLCRTPRLPVALNGTGDAFTALFLGAWLRTGDVARTLEHAVAAMFALVEVTHRAGSRELVRAQYSLVAPARPFPAVRVA